MAVTSTVLQTVVSTPAAVHVTQAATVETTVTASAGSRQLDNEAVYCGVFLGILDHLDKVEANVVANDGSADMTFWADDAADAVTTLTNLDFKYLHSSGGTGDLAVAIGRFWLVAASLKLAADGSASTNDADAAINYKDAVKAAKDACA